MKKIILTLVLAGALLAGCNSNSKGKNPFDSISGQNQANEIIGFYNDALEFYKRNSSYTDDVVDYVDEAQEFLQKKASGGVAIKPIRPMKMITVSAKDNLKVPDGFGDKKEIIEKAFEALKTHSDKIGASAVEINSYLEAEDYKDDQGKKLQDLKKTIQEEATAFYDSHDTLFDAMRAIVDQAEESILKDHPLKDNILATKKLLTQEGDLLDEVLRQGEANTFDEAKLQTLYKNIEDLLDKNRKIEVKSKTPSDKTNYEDIHKATEKFLGAARKLIRNGKENKTISERDYNDLSDEYKDVISAYNSFVN
jgi:hypothetical protein